MEPKAHSLAEITTVLKKAVSSGDLGAIADCVADLERLIPGGFNEVETNDTSSADRIVDMLAQAMWSDDDCQLAYRSEWDGLTDELKRECLANLALDIECQFFRLGDPMRGCSPLEYLSMKFAEQEWYRREREAREQMSEEEKQKRQQMADYLRDDSPGPSVGLTPAEYVAKCMAKRGKR